ncbi:missing minor mitochondria [Arctopsyche grandis]|uniref:missing minor mitochondria n=1 Tax=Arctopsyche grandis TaxID=121162 RepID=UPI00406D8E1F
MNIDSEDDDDVFLDHLDSLKEKTLVQMNNFSVDDEPTKRKKKFVPNYDVEGVYKIILNELTQTSLGVVVGLDVTCEQPWKIVKKELLFDNIAVLGDESPFAALTSDLQANENEDILLGYIPDETNDSDDFYICLTPEARSHCEVQAIKFLKKQAKKLERAVQKVGKPWQSLGSEKEVDDTISKNSRPLIQVELKTKFPKPNQPDRFTKRLADDVKDAYTELITNRIKYENVFKKRVDFAVQATPETVSSEAQTIPKFPENVWTQCSVEDADIKIEQIDLSSSKSPETEDFEEMEEEKEEEEEEEAHENENEEQEEPIKVVEEDLQIVVDPINEQALKLLNLVKFNSVIDKYNIDYPALIKDEKHCQSTDDIYFEEKSCFRSAKTKDKVVSSVSWHSMWSGIIAVAYTNVAHYNIIKVTKEVDEIQQDIYGYNSVLLWSIYDTLNPILYLESTREVRTVSFCPFKENLLIGGCVNGQVMLWDLQDKLKEAEKIEVLTEEQQKYRSVIYSQIGWPKKINSETFIRQTVLSNLRTSHAFDVTDFAWVHPNIEIADNGKLKTLNDEVERSLQFLSISLDGCILIWNLKASQADDGNETLSEKVQINPSELGMDVSPYKVLNGKFEPLYKIIVGTQGRVPLTSLSFTEIEIKYDLKESCRAAERRTFYPLVQPIKENVSQAILLGSLYGEVFKISWMGQDDDIEPAVNVEDCKFGSRVKIHDGSIACTVRNPFCKNIFATVGGKVFAIWIDSLLDKPLMWKKTQYRLTKAVWSSYRPSQIFITGEKGNVDVWDFMHCSNAPIATQIISGNALIGIYMNIIPNEDKVIAVADLNGSLRIFRLSDSLASYREIDVVYTKEFFDRELVAKDQHYDWEKAWYIKHAELLEKAKKQELVKQRERERLNKIEARKELERKELEEERRREERKRVITPQEKWKKMQWLHAVKTIQEKKRLDKMELLKQVKPLRDLEQSCLSRQRKYVETLQNQQKVFNETVAILYPEVVTKPTEPVKLTPIDQIKEATKQVLEDYERMAGEAKKFIKDNPFKGEFEWQKMMMEGKERRRALDVANIKRLKSVDFEDI